MYRTCVVFVTGTTVLTVITLSSQNFDGSGKSRAIVYQSEEAIIEESEDEEIDADTKANVQTTDNSVEIKTQRILLKDRPEKESVVSAKEKNQLSIVTLGQEEIIQNEKHNTESESITALQGESVIESESITVLQEESVTESESITALQEESVTESESITALQGESVTESESITVLQEQETQPEIREVLVADNGNTAKYNEFMASITLTEEEKSYLLHLVAAEAGGCDMVGQILVANVVLNRVESSVFPDTVAGVIFQKNQFSPTINGAIWSSTITDSVEEAVERALAGEDFSEGATFFSARARLDSSSMSWFDNNLNWLFKHDGHEFYSLK